MTKFELALQGQAVTEQLPVLQLPTDHPRKAQQRAQRAVCPFAFTKEETDRLQAVGQQAQTSWPATLFSGFLLLLHRYTQQSDLLVGSSFAAREWGANSPFLVRTDVSAVQTVPALLAQVQQAMEHGQAVANDLPLDALQSVTVAFAIGVTSWFTEQETACELHVSFEETETGLVGRFTYNVELWEQATIERMAGHLQRLLFSIAQHPEAGVLDLRMLSVAETEQLLVEWNRTSTVYPQQSLQEVFEDIAAKTPDATALVFGNDTLSYGELNRHANRLAHQLIGLGVGPDVLVGICAERSLEMVVGLLAIVKAGGAYVPFDANYPDERLLTMFEDSQVQVLLCQQNLLYRLPARDVTTLLLDDVLVEADAGVAEGNENPPAQATLDNLAYINYTSGSTGKPKGVCVPQRGVMRLVKENDFIHFGADEVFLQYASISFDAATLEIWGPLLNGAKLVICQAGQLSLEMLGDVLQAYEVTTLWLTAGLFQQMVELNVDSLGTVRQLLAGGDVLSVPHVKKVLERWPQMALTNGYGPTESTTFATTYTLTAAQLSAGSLPIGRPIANTRIYVLDPNQQPVPIGVPGELYIGGDGLARGYLNRDDLTAEKFVTHAFGAREERLYRTGDLVRYLPDGIVEFLGRIDNQVKIRGFRIELGEIEAVLSEHPDVHSCVAVAHTSETGEKRLVAYVVLQQQASELDKRVLATMLTEIRQHVQSKLPAYAVPSLLQPVPQLPLTANGKVDVRALPAPDFSWVVGEEESVAPRTQVEELLVGLYEQTLGLEKVGLFANFFDLGGHSLLATKLITRIRETFGVDIKLNVLFEAPTVAELATHVQAAQQGGEVRSLPPIIRHAQQGDVPASFAQQQMWLINRLQNGGVSYNLPFAVHIDGALMVDALERSLQEIVNRHEALRTRFLEIEGQLVQRIDASMSVQLPLVDFTGVTDESPEQAAEAWMSTTAARPFDLASEHLITFALLKIGEFAHVLFFNMHHIVGDGWSMSIFAEELSQLYKAFVAGEPASLETLPVQYTDFARWQREHVGGEAIAAQLAYWREQLASELPLLQLPTDRPRSQAGTRRGAVHFARVPQAVAGGLRQLSKREGVTLYMTLLAAFNTWLHRISGQDDLLVGVPNANRTQREIERLIGYFVNTQVLRNDLSGDPSFRELLGRVRQVVIDAHLHADVPFETLVEALQPARSSTLTPFFQVMFQLTPTWRFELEDVNVSSRELFNGSAKFDLYVALTEEDEELAIRMEYDTDLFDQTTIERMAGHFEQVLAGVVANPDARLWELPLLSAQERKLVLHTWNDTQTDYPQQSIQEVFEAQALQTPDHVAVVYGQDSLTYAELNRYANRLARRLQAQGVGANVRVGICAERSLEMVVGLLAIVKAGGAYVPFDANYPDERLRYLVEDSQVTVLLVQQALLERIPAQETPTILLDDVLDDNDNMSDNADFANVAVSSTIDDLAYLNYTSGSTGKPKGVCIPHRGVVRLVKEASYISFSADEVFLQYAPISFDAATLEIWGALLNGAKLVICPAGQLSLEALGEVLETHRVTTMWLTAGLFQQMVEHHVESLGSLRQLLAGGDVLSVPHVKKVLQRWPHLALTNGYGPTESTTFTNTYTVTAGDQIEGSLPIGRPIASTTNYILDSHMQPVPIGVPGELYIGGDGLAQGYWNRPEMTEERFVPNPFGPTGSRLYKTGDLVRYLSDGNVEFLGRIDNQVKIRGFRIELGEIETELMKQASVQEAFVIAHPFAPGDKRLIGYVVPASGAELSTRDLRTSLKATLPDYMVPALFVVLEAFPLTPNGKINRAALPLPELGKLDLEHAYVAPRTDLEIEVERIFADVLHMEKVGVDDNFFDLGGHSLLAIQIVSRIRRDLEVALPVSDLFDAPTVAGIAERVAAALATGAHEQEIVITPVSRDGDLALSFAQQRLYFLDQLEPGSTNYNVPVMLRMRGVLDKSALERSLQEIVQRHESLRTTFVEKDGMPVQVIAEEIQLELPQFDLTNVAAGEREDALRQLVLQEASRSFDLFTGPLFRPCLIVLQEQEHVLFLNAHHIIIDGWSVGVFTRELAELYAAFVQGEAPPLAKLPIQYADFAIWQRNWLAGDVLQKQLGYWKAQLGGTLPVLNLAPGQERPDKLGQQGVMYHFDIPAELTTAIHSFAEREGATLFMTLLTAYKALLLRHSGQSDLLVGMPIAGRNHSEIEHLIGFFVNTLVLRTDLSGNPTFRESLHRVKTVALAAFTHQDVPYDKLVDELRADRDKGLFQTMFQLLHGNETLTMHGLEMDYAEVHNGTAKFDLTFTIVDHGDGKMAANFEYNCDLYQASLIERLSKQFVKLLETAIQEPNQHLNSLKLGSEPHGFDEDELDELF